MLIFLFTSLFPRIKTADEFGSANISLSHPPSFSITYQEKFSISDFRTYDFRWNGRRFQLGLSRFGNSFYRELELRGAFLLKPERNIILSLKPSIIVLSQEEKHYKGASFDLSTVFVASRIKLKFQSRHLISWLKNKTIPMQIEMMGIHEDEWNRSAIKVSFEENWGLRIGTSFSLKFPDFSVTLGLLTNPTIPTGALNVNYRNIIFSAGFQNHGNLGLSKNFTVFYKI